MWMLGFGGPQALPVTAQHPTATGTMNVIVGTPPLSQALGLRRSSSAIPILEAAARAGLAGLTPHELRHTAASLAISSGANVKAVQRMLGHASAAMTLDVYSGRFEDDLDVVDVVAERMSAARDRVVPHVCPKPVRLPVTQSKTAF
jgi:integrase